MIKKKKNHPQNGNRRKLPQSLLTMVHIAKAIVFPAVMYRCERWTIKKTGTEELMFSNCGAGEDS